MKTRAVINEVKERWVSETPTHFNRTKKTGFIVAGAGLTIKILAAIFPPTMPAGIVALAPELISIGLIVAGVSKTARVDGAKPVVYKKGIAGFLKKWL